MNTPTDDDSSLSLPTPVYNEEECRICRENGTTERPLISPCECTGSMKTVHGDCLQRWMHSRPRTVDEETGELIENITDNDICEVCHTPYRYGVEYRYQGNNPSYYLSVPALGHTAQCGWLTLLALAVLYGLYTVRSDDKNNAESSTTSDYVVLGIFFLAAIIGTIYASKAIYLRWRRSVSAEILVDIPRNNQNGTVTIDHRNNQSISSSSSSSSSRNPPSGIARSRVPSTSNEDNTTSSTVDNEKKEEESTLLLSK